MKKYSLQDTPNEVWKAWALMTSPIGVGMEGIKFIEQCIEKYPEYFEWETKFRSIPESVYEAYLDEVYPDRHKKDHWTIDDYRKEHNGIIPEILASNQKPYSKTTTDQDLVDAVKWFGEMYDRERERKIAERKEEARKEVIWNKHFKKYGLKYRSSNIHF